MSVAKKLECLECSASFPDANLPYDTKPLVQALLHLGTHGLVGGLSDDPAREAGLPAISSFGDPNTHTSTYTQAGRSVRIRG